MVSPAASCHALSDAAAARAVDGALAQARIMGVPVAFYTRAFGMTEVFRIGPLALAGTPGGGDSLALHLATTEKERARIGQQAGWSTSASAWQRPPRPRSMRR